MSIDLERFPWSDSANRMLTYVTKGWYDKSYVGKWIYEVMGRELDLATVHIEELPYQMFIDTATWGLKYHEIKYGLPVREDLSYEERRRLLREKKNTKAPMTPWRMEQILKGVTDYDVQVHDCNEPGYYFSHPNIFSVQLEGETEVELGEVKSKVDKLKQSHTVYLLSVILMLIECTESFEQRVTYHSDFSWWKYSLDGSFALDGSINLNHWHPTEFRPVYPFDTVLTENFIADRIFHRMDNLFEVAFATRNSQSIMSGCTGYYNRFYATVVENNVERIIISKSDANYLVVGSTVSIGNATALSGSNPTDDRANAGLHAKANRVIITKIEDYDSNNSAVYVDNGGTKFSTGSTMVGSTEVKTTIVTMPWHTGACDNVLGSCGSPNSNTSGKDPYILFGVEMFLGFYEVISNVILKISNHVMTACICYDCTKLATSVTSDYVECGYSIADTQASWKYISELGYDPENPSVRHGTKVAASSSTGYADGQYTDKLDQTSDGLREWLSGGHLVDGSLAGRWSAFLNNGLGGSWWLFAARLSASGRCAKAAA